MKLAVFYDHIRDAALQKSCTISEMLERIKRLGIEDVELNGDRISDPKGLKKQFDDAGLGVSSIYSVYDWSRHPEDIHDGKQIELALLFNSKFIMPIPGLYTEEGMHSKEKNREELSNMISGMKRIAEAAQAAGVQITLEDYDNAKSPIATIDGMQRFLNEIPGLTVTLDTGNFYYSGENVLEAYRVFREKIAHVHLKDRYIASVPDEDTIKTHFGKPYHAVSGESMYPCAVGQGVIPIQTVIERLSRDGYEGMMTIEHFGAVSPWETICGSVKYVREAAALPC